MRRLLCSLAYLVALSIGSSAQAGPALLIEVSSGKVLYSEDADQVWQPASLTKIMTAYLTFEAIKTGKLKLDSKLTVSELAHLQQPSKIGLPVGAEMTVELALKALIIKSANDVAVMLAEGIDGTVEQFAERMNATAKRLGMTRSSYRNPHGLPEPEQTTSARDLARLSLAAIKDYPEYAALWSMNDMMIGRRRLRTHNMLLRTYEGADGMKTGFICDSGYNVVASATRDGRRLMAVVLGEMSGHERAVRAASLLEHGFQTYDWKQIFMPATLDNLPVGESKGPATMKEAVLEWRCGPRGRPRVAAKAGVKTKVKPKGGTAAAQKQPAAKQALQVNPKSAATAPARVVPATKNVQQQ